MNKGIQLVSLIALLTLSGCASNNASTSTSKLEEPPVYDKIDINMTTMNETKLSLTYDSFFTDPGYYKDKIVKVAGPFQPSPSNDVNYCYPAIFLFKDSTGCCDYGLEFLLYDVPRCSMAGGNGYPLYDEQAVIVGRFEKYYEGGSLWVHLVDALWLKD